jgi:hypothetical protein
MAGVDARIPMEAARSRKRKQRMVERLQEGFSEQVGEKN